MGVSSSRIEEDKALHLCRLRKKCIRQALDGRCSLAAAHFSYIESLRNTGNALRKFVEPEGPIESSLYTSTSATPEPLALTEKSNSHFSFSSPNFSRVDATENLSPSPSPPVSTKFQANHMRFRGMSTKKVEEKPPSPVIGTVTSSSTPQNTTPRSDGIPESSTFEASSVAPETPPWDYFGLVHPVDHQFSFQEENGMSHGFENFNDVTRVREDEEETASFNDRDEFRDSEDEFDEPSADTLVRNFDNLNRLNDHKAATTPPARGGLASEKEFVNGKKINSPDLSPVRAASSISPPPSDTKKTPAREDCNENKLSSKDFFSSMKDIESLFIRASESGKEVPKMLEANKLHFRPILPAKESGSATSTFFKACFSCGEDPSQPKEEPAGNDVKYLTWHRTTSSRSSSSRNLIGLNSKDDIDDFTSNIFDSISMISASHASTLDRLYAWEMKLYDEVKASQMIRREYDLKCKILRELESKGESSQRIDKTRAVVKDLHSRIRVAIHRIDSVSKRIEEYRDKELQPQLEELIEGLSRMWAVMFECHKLQFQIISVAYQGGNSRIFIESDSHRHITVHLEMVLSSLSSSFTKWIEAQKSYIKAIDNWLFKCLIIPEKHSKRKRRIPPPSMRSYGPPIYDTCGTWLDKLDSLPSDKLTNSIRDLVAEIAHFLPRQGKKAENGGDAAVNNMLREEATENWISGLDHFRSRLEGFLSQLSNFAEFSVKMYAELEETIERAKARYKEMMNPETRTSS